MTEANESSKPLGLASTAMLGPTRELVIRIARAAGVNGDPAGPGDDGIDTWYGNQYLPCGALTKLVALAMAEEQARWVALLRSWVVEAERESRAEAAGWLERAIDALTPNGLSMTGEDGNERSQSFGIIKA